MLELAQLWLLEQMTVTYKLYFNYNTAAFGENIFAGGKVSFECDAGSLCDQGIDLIDSIKIYGGFTVNDNTSSRVSWAFSQIYANSTFAADNVTETPTKLVHLKIEFTNSAEMPMVVFEDGTSPTDYTNQFFTACGSAGGGVTDLADCTGFPGTQIFNDTFDSSGATLSVDALVLNQLKVYPNPTEGLVYINGDRSGLNSIQVYTILGQELMHQRSNLEQVDLSRFEPAVLFLKLNGEGGSKIVKIIKE